MNTKEHLAHISDDKREQSMSDHAEAVATLCADYAASSIGEEWRGLAHFIGYQHDLGKYNPDWQSYLLRARGLEEGTAISVHHSATGAIYAQKKLPSYLSRIASYCIASHHRGLYNSDDLKRRLALSLEQRIYDKAMQQGQVYPTSLLTPLSTLESKLQSMTRDKGGRLDLQMFVRMMFSCLVDADARDTELFMTPNIGEQRARLTQPRMIPKWEELRERLQTYTDRFVADSQINEARARFLAQCRAHGSQASRGIYSLFLPTGGGKTISSVAWALETAERHGLERIIIVLPFTSIITQTSDTLRKIFRKDYVLEHHSDIDIEKNLKRLYQTDHIDSSNLAEEDSRTKILADNWQGVPFIVTTNVQLFESLFANRPSKCRKVHSIANSVLIFDECQAFPIEQLSPMLRSIESLSRSFGTQTLLCTATQPIFSEEIQSLGDKESLYRIKLPITDVVPFNPSDFIHFSRTAFHLDMKEYTIEELSDELLQHTSVLCIVNTRRDACHIYETLKEKSGEISESLIHLSRMMCSEHLSQSIELIRDRMAQGRPTRVISTQLIEAGVDLDFPVVYRAHTGLDSIIQAAGRCNREGKLPQKGAVYTFNLTDGSRAFPSLMKAQYATEEVMQLEGFDPRSPEIIKEYYRRLLSRHSIFDKGGMLQYLWHIKVSRTLEFDFESAQEKFKLIDNEGSFDIFVPYGMNGQSIIQKITANQWLSRDEIRLLQRLRVGVRQRDLSELLSRGSASAINLWGDEKRPIFVLIDQDSYSSEIGINMKNHYLEEVQLV